MKAYLTSIHVGVSATENLLKQRIVHCGTHLQAKTGDCAVAYFLFADRLFPSELKQIPKVFCMNKKHPFYIVLYHPELDASDLEYYVHSLCIYPELLAKQAAAIKRDIDGLKHCNYFQLFYIIIYPSTKEKDDSCNVKSISKSSLQIVYAETEANIIQMLGGKTEVIGSEKSCFP